MIVDNCQVRRLLSKRKYGKQVAYVRVETYWNDCMKEIFRLKTGNVREEVVTI